MSQRCADLWVIIQRKFWWYFGNLDGGRDEKTIGRFADRFGCCCRALHAQRICRPRRKPTRRRPWSRRLIAGPVLIRRPAAATACGMPTPKCSFLWRCLPGPALSDTFGGRGYFGTAGGGYDFQLGGLGMGAWNPTIVVGLMADYNFESFKGTNDVVGAARRADQRNRRLGRRRPRWFGLRSQSLHLHQTVARPAPVLAVRASSHPSPACRLGICVGGILEDRLVPRRRHRDFAGSDIAGRLFPAQRISLRLLQHHQYSVLIPAAYCRRSVIGFHPVVQTLSTSLVYKFNWQ